MHKLDCECHCPTLRCSSLLDRPLSIAYQEHLQKSTAGLISITLTVTQSLIIITNTRITTSINSKKIKVLLSNIGLTMLNLSNFKENLAYLPYADITDIITGSSKSPNTLWVALNNLNTGSSYIYSLTQEFTTDRT